MLSSDEKKREIPASVRIVEVYEMIMVTYYMSCSWKKISMPATQCSNANNNNNNNNNNKTFIYIG